MSVYKTLVRERRHQEALRLPLPLPTPEADLWNRTLSPSPLSFSTSNSCGTDNLSDLEKLVILGHGSGGTVYKVRHRKTSAVYALKVLRFGKDVAAMAEQQAAQEAEILRQVDSQFVVRCHGVFDHGFTDIYGGGDLCFIMEYMEAGSLHDVLRTRRRLPEKLISVMAQRVLEGLNYLHSMQIVHRDIKPSNLLINNKGEIKIADFGVSRVGRCTARERDSSMGTCAYMSPERFDPEGWNGDCSDGFAGDVWSLGVVVLECHVGHFPLIGQEQKPDWTTLMCAICFGERVQMPETASPEFRNFVWRCLEKDWRMRGTVKELLVHPFVTKDNSGFSEELVGYALHC
ncbi:unnamed protein product [Ilex paraguariensis]|uniref:Protein kinase domain-containing protein n=1 Tax=Ilex paraguariensis TaxID=185542 RepID=A0ABC8TW59_9AQUA